VAFRYLWLGKVKAPLPLSRQARDTRARCKVANGGGLKNLLENFIALAIPGTLPKLSLRGDTCLWPDTKLGQDKTIFESVGKF
jgi:hypothetical protein